MKEFIKYWSIVVLCIIGGFNVLMWGIDRGRDIESLFNDTTKYEILEERHEAFASMSYGVGRMWGEITARYYDDNKDDLNLNGDYYEVASQMLDDRVVDFYCWGSDDCGELPTNEELLHNYHIDNRTGNMPIYAFRSGFVDSFVEYMEIYS